MLRRVVLVFAAVAVASSAAAQVVAGGSLIGGSSQITGGPIGAGSFTGVGQQGAAQGDGGGSIGPAGGGLSASSTANSSGLTPPPGVFFSTNANAPSIGDGGRNSRFTQGRGGCDFVTRERYLRFSCD